MLKYERAIDAVCAWPNLSLLPDQTIIAAIWNQPCHGTWEGDVDAWASKDGGETWDFRGRITAHEPGMNRMNCAAGLAHNGDLLILVSGWSDCGVMGHSKRRDADAHTLQAGSYRSADSGRTWLQVGELPASGERFSYVPFGDVSTAKDGALCVTAYIWHAAAEKHSCYFFRSYDDGVTWAKGSCLNPLGDETSILHLEDGRWLAVSRQEDQLYGFTSHDDGQSWESSGVISRPKEVTSHLLRLHDGRVLLSYGNRIEGECGVEARWSEDEGRTWSAPLRLADMPDWDGGYPSSIERPDGQIVTAYYSNHRERGDHQYQMNTVVWKP